jgi:hypothetical protein
VRLVALVLLALGLALLLMQQHEARAEESRLGAIASDIAGRHVSVHCQGRVGAALDVSAEEGSVRFDASGRPADFTDLKRRVCRALDSFAADPTSAGPRELSALNTLAHESWHLAGIAGEAEAECRALQTIATVARRLGADPVVAQTLAVRFARDDYRRLPPAYQTGQCRNGGPLDLRPNDPVWP